MHCFAFCDSRSNNFLKKFFKKNSVKTSSRSRELPAEAVCYEVFKMIQDFRCLSSLRLYDDIRGDKLESPQQKWFIGMS